MTQAAQTPVGNTPNQIAPASPNISLQLAVPKIQITPFQPKRVAPLAKQAAAQVVVPSASVSQQQSVAPMPAVRQQQVVVPTPLASPQQVTTQAKKIVATANKQVQPTTPVKKPVQPAPAPAPKPIEKVKVQSTTDVLINEGHITSQQADKIYEESLGSGRSQDDVLLEKKLVSSEVLTKAKAKFNNIPFIRIADTGVDPEALTQVGEGIAKRYGMLPFAYNKKDGTLMVAMKDPLDLLATNFVEQKTGLKLMVHYAMPFEIDLAVSERYSQNISSDVTRALEESDQYADAQKLRQAATQGQDVMRDAPINRIVETVLSFAIKTDTSDVHIEPEPTRTRVRYRIDGILQEKLVLPKTVHEAVVSRIKILSNLKIDEKRVPQDGRFSFTSKDKSVDLRVSTLPTVNGEKVVMRLLKKNTVVPTLEELGMRGLALKIVNESITKPNGIILVTGPTGSGKTTTLYSVLHKINTPRVNILTLENPVEYQMRGISQVQVNVPAGLTFASGLRSFLRQDPDIMMVGEIRDTETASLAVEASLTGHMVFSTLHTNSAAGALPRLLDMSIEPFLLASSVTVVMGQRVVRKLNPEFVEEYKPESAVIEDIKKVLGPRLDQWLQENNKTLENIILFRGSKAAPSKEVIYKGRVAIYEVMKFTEEIGKLVMQRKAGNEIEKVALRNGMLLMKQDGYLRALEGMTTIEEVLRVAQV